MQLGQLPGDGEADARALLAAGQRRAGPVEPLEQVGDLVGIDAGPGVRDLEHYEVALAALADRHPALEGVLEGVGEEVEHDLVPHLGVDRHRRVGSLDVDRVVEPGILHRGDEHARERLGRARQVHRSPDGLQPPSLQSREVEQGVDELEQPDGVPVGHRQLLGRGVRKGGGILQYVSQRAEQQREGRAELVAHVAEEGGLRAVEGGQLLGSLALGLVGFGGRDAGRDLPCDQAKERVVVLVQLAAGVDAGHENARGLPAAWHPERDHDRVRHGLAVLRRHAEPRRDRDDAGLAVANRGNDLPRVALPPVSHPVHGDRGRSIVRDPGSSRQARDAALRISQVDQRERHVVRIRREGRRDRRAGGHAIARAHRSGRDVPQRPHAPLGQDTLRRLDARHEHAADATRLVEDGAVGEGEVRLLAVPRALHQQEQVLGPRRRPGLHDPLVEGPDHVPDLGPALVARLPEGARVLVAEDGPVAVVVDLCEVRPPPQEHGEARLEADARGRAEALGPRRDGPEGRVLPIERTGEAPHLPTAAEYGITWAHASAGRKCGPAVWCALGRQSRPGRRVLATPSRIHVNISRVR